MTINSTIFQMFGRSPVAPLQAHMNKAFECTQYLVPFFIAISDQDWTTAESTHEKIATLEHEADIIKKDLRIHLPNSLLMPVSRSDVLEILTVQDEIPNLAEDISGLIIGRRMQIPAPLQQYYVDFVKRCIDAVHQADNVVNHLDELFSTGFKGHIINTIEEKITKLDEIEQDTDKAQVKLRRELFNIEADLPPVDVIFLYKIIQWIGDLADNAQSVGGRLQLLLAH